MNMYSLHFQSRLLPKRWQSYVASEVDATGSISGRNIYNENGRLVVRCAFVGDLLHGIYALSGQRQSRSYATCDCGWTIGVPHWLSRPDVWL